MGDDRSPPDQACRSAALSKSGSRIARLRSISIGMTLPAAASGRSRSTAKKLLTSPSPLRVPSAIGGESEPMKYVDPPLPIRKPTLPAGLSLGSVTASSGPARMTLQCSAFSCLPCCPNWAGCLDGRSGAVVIHKEMRSFSVLGRPSLWRSSGDCATS